MPRYKKFTGDLISLFFVLLFSSCTWMARDFSDSGIVWEEPEIRLDAGAVEDKKTGLPLISILTEDGKAITSKEEYLAASVSIKAGDGGVIVTGNRVKAVSSGDSITSAAARIRGRGNTTWRKYSKKPYRLKLFEKQKMFGLAEAKSWVLLANARDESLLKNMLAFRMGQELGLPFTNSCVPADLVINDVYLGSYLLTEQVQTGRGRVDIDENEGYLAEFDGYYDEAPKFRTSPVPFPVMVKTPGTLVTGFADNFVKQSLDGLIGKLFADGALPDPGWRDLADIDTFVKYVFVQEFMSNPDFWKLFSVYFYKDKDGKICAGPLWDFDKAFSGNPSAPRTITGSGEAELGEALFRRIYSDPVFRQEYKALWNGKKEAVRAFADDGTGFIDMISAKLKPSWELDYYVRNGFEAADNRYEQIIADIKTWWRTRCDFIEEELN